MPAASLSSASDLLCNLHKSFPSLGLPGLPKAEFGSQPVARPVGLPVHEHKCSHCPSPSLLSIAAATGQELHLFCCVSSPQCQLRTREQAQRRSAGGQGPQRVGEWAG